MGKTTDHAGIVPVISEYDKLIEEILELELKLAALAEEIDDLENHICVELRADYDQKVGNLEYQAQAYRLEIARLKRAIELLQAAINRQEAAKYEEVQKKVEQEYKQYEEDLNKKAEDMKRDKEYKERRAKQDKKNEEKAEEERKAREEGKDTRGKASGGKDGESADKEDSSKDKDKKEDEKSSETNSEDREKAEDAGLGNDSETIHETPKEELKRLYRMIMKKLHPDANPNATEKDKALLLKAQKAYAEGDLETLREIADQLDDTDITEKYSDNPDDIAKLRELRAKLAEKVEILLAHIDEIKNSFPYTEKDFLANEDAVKARQEELAEYNRQCADKIIELQEKILELSKVAEKNEKEAKKRKAKKE
ncbi:hypothetical protein [Butyrivibrio sp. VCB2006]|uniref:hypothetical protein n=1 Tax=Butyrivibrio sp. VCB2006 TaxID=1280679 RepID=UPI000426992E|nr:hypothetical protein [Butyrivibrio sp. VCB2006]